MRRVLTTTLFLAFAAAPALAQSTSQSSSSQSSNDFRWAGQVDRGKALEIKGVNGDIRAELASGNQVEVVATKRGRRSDPGSVSVQVVQQDGNVTICAVYPTPSGSWGRRGRRGWDGPNECRPGTDGRMNVKDNDVSVDFTVRVPAGVRFYGKTVNGSIDAISLRSDADVATVNGRIELSTTGMGSANTVNGSIDASIGAGDGKEPIEFRTVNGSITVALPKDLSADLHAQMLNGHFESDIPVTIQSFRGRGNRRVSGTIGKGGRDLDLHTVNGSIRLRSVTP